MPRLAQRSLAFTAKLIENLAPEAKRYRVSDKKQRGLKIVVLPSGRKYWTVKYVLLDGRESEKMLGEWPSLPIEQARVDAGLVRARIQRQHADPAEEVRRTRREAEEQRIAEARARAYTFARLAREYLDASKLGFRAPKQRHRKSASTIYREEKVLAKHVLPKLGSRPITEIRRRDIINIVEKVAQTCGEGAANGVVASVRRCFAYARYKDEIEHNPAIEITQFARPPRDVVASDDQIRLLWELLEKAKGDDNQARGKRRHPQKDAKSTALALQLCMLTLQRRGEVVSIHRTHIDWHNSIWTIPTLNKKERRIGLVPLAPMALAVLEQAFAHSGSDWAFAGRGTGKHMDAHSLTKFMDRLREVSGLERITPHDLRRTGRTKLTSDEVGVDEMTAERVLNHVVGSRQQRAYDWQQYTTQKRAALVAWEKELTRIIADGPPSIDALPPEFDMTLASPVSRVLH